MAVYTSVPILEALISDVARHPFCNDSLTAMVSSILSYYFPATQDFAVCYKEAQGDFSSHFLVRRLRNSQSGRRVLVNHLIVVFSDTGMFVGQEKLGSDLKNILAHTELEGPNVGLWLSTAQSFRFSCTIPINRVRTGFFRGSFRGRSTTILACEMTARPLTCG